MRTSSPRPRRRQLADRRAGRLGLAVLLDREVARRERGDLRQVRDAQDLAAVGQRAQLRADRPGRVAADARVDLVEDERSPSAPSLATPIRASITRESSPPEAISRSGPAGTPAFGAMRNSTASAPVGAGSRSCSAISKLRALHGQLGQTLADRAGQRRGLRPRAHAQRRSRGLRLLGTRRLELGPRVAPAPPRRPRARRAARGSARRGRGRRRSCRRACARGARARPGAPRPSASSAAGLAVEPLGVAQQLAGQVVGLVGQRAPALGQRVEPRRRRRRRRRAPRRRPPAAPSPPSPRRAPPPARRRAPLRAAPRGGAGARARRAARPPRPREGSAASISASSNASRSSSRSRAPARSRSSASDASSSRTRA